MLEENFLTLMKVMNLYKQEALSSVNKKILIKTYYNQTVRCQRNRILKYQEVTYRVHRMMINKINSLFLTRNRGSQKVMGMAFKVMKEKTKAKTIF